MMRILHIQDIDIFVSAVAEACGFQSIMNRGDALPGSVEQIFSFRVSRELGEKMLMLCNPFNQVNHSRAVLRQGVVGRLREQAFKSVKSHPLWPMLAPFLAQANPKRAS